MWVIVRSALSGRRGTTHQLNEETIRFDIVVHKIPHVFVIIGKGDSVDSAYRRKGVRLASEDGVDWVDLWQEEGVAHRSDSQSYNLYIATFTCTFLFHL